MTNPTNEPKILKPKFRWTIKQQRREVLFSMLNKVVYNGCENPKLRKHDCTAIFNKDPIADELLPILVKRFVNHRQINVYQYYNRSEIQNSMVQENNSMLLVKNKSNYVIIVFEEKDIAWILVWDLRDCI